MRLVFTIVWLLAVIAWLILSWFVYIKKKDEYTVYMWLAIALIWVGVIGK